MPSISMTILLGLALLGSLVTAAPSECSYPCVTQADCWRFPDCANNPNCCPAAVCNNGCCEFNSEPHYDYDYIGQGRCRDVNNNGGGYFPTQATGVVDCLEKCQDDPQCKGIEFSADGCELHRNKPHHVYYDKNDKLSDCFARK